MAWQLTGMYFENCSCDMVCPCTTSAFSLPGDYERCRVVLAFHVDSGAVDDVDVSKLTVAVVADAPQLMSDGIEDFVPPGNPGGPVSMLTGMLHPANSTLTTARATASRVDAFGLHFENGGKNGHSAPFSWAA